MKSKWSYPKYYYAIFNALRQYYLEFFLSSNLIKISEKIYKWLAYLIGFTTF